MENHHAINGKTHYKLPFSTAMLVITRPGILMVDGSGSRLDQGGARCEFVGEEKPLFCSVDLADNHSWLVVTGTWGWVMAPWYLLFTPK